MPSEPTRYAPRAVRQFDFDISDRENCESYWEILFIRENGSWVSY